MNSSHSFLKPPVSSAQSQQKVNTDPGLSMDRIRALQVRQCLFAMGFVALVLILALIAVVRMHGFTYGQV